MFLPGTRVLTPGSNVQAPGLGCCGLPPKSHQDTPTSSPVFPPCSVSLGQQPDFPFLPAPSSVPDTRGPAGRAWVILHCSSDEGLRVLPRLHPTREGPFTALALLSTSTCLRPL